MQTLLYLDQSLSAQFYFFSLFFNSGARSFVAANRARKRRFQNDQFGTAILKFFLLDFFFRFNWPFQCTTSITSASTCRYDSQTVSRKFGRFRNFPFFLSALFFSFFFSVSFFHREYVDVNVYKLFLPGQICATRLSRVCLEESLKYALRRQTFGKLLHEHQAIRMKVAAMARRIECLQAWLESIVREAVWRMRLGRRRRSCCTSIRPFRMKVAAMARRIECLRAWVTWVTLVKETEEEGVPTRAYQRQAIRMRAYRTSGADGVLRLH